MCSVAVALKKSSRIVERDIIRDERSGIMPKESEGQKLGLSCEVCFRNRFLIGYLVYIANFGEY